MRRHVRQLAGVALMFASACSDVPARDAHAAASRPQGEGGATMSLDSALTLFRRDLEPIAELENGERSIDALIERLVTALEKSDTAALRDIVMSRREFAYLYYPTSVFTRPPMKQEPGLVWFLHLQHSEKGATRLLRRYAGRELRLTNTCKPPKTEGANRLWFDCVQRVVTSGDTTTVRLFGGVYERNRRFKIFSYSNDL